MLPNTMYTITGGVNPMTEARKEQARQNQAVYEDVQAAHPLLMKPHANVDCGLWELEQAASIHDADTLEDRLQQRKKQRDAVIDLVTEKVKENYTRFVEGINKIQEVGACSAETTQICDHGIASIRGTKSGLVLNALTLAGNHRRRQNMRAVRDMALQVRTIHNVQLEVQRQIKAGNPTEALVAMIEGQKAAEDLQHVDCVRALVRRWDDEKNRLYRDHVDHLLEASCVDFNPTRFASVAKAAALMNREQEAAAELTRKWWKYTQKTLSCVRPHAAKTHSPETLQNADARQLIKMCTAHNIALALFDVLYQLTDKMWVYSAMLSWCEDNHYRAWADELRAKKPDYWAAVQASLCTFFQHCSFHTLELSSLFDILVAYRIFYSFLTVFHKPADKKLDDAVDNLTQKYLHQVFHKGNIEITRVQAVNERCVALTPQQIFQRVKDTLGVGTVVPREEDVLRMCDHARHFVRAADPRGNPFTNLSDRLAKARQPLDEKAVNVKMQSFLAISADGISSAKVTLTGVDMILRLSHYTDIMVAFPRLSVFVDKLKSDLVCFLAYSVYCSYCGVDPTPAGQSPVTKESKRPGGDTYVPEKDPYVPESSRRHLEAVRDLCLKLLAKDASSKAKDDGDASANTAPAANPLASLVSTTNRHIQNVSSRLGLLERSIALSSLKFVVDYSARTEHNVASRDPSQLNQIQLTLRAVTRSLRKRLAFHLFPVDHYVKLIHESKWEPKSLETEPSVYVNKMIREFRTFSDCLTDAKVVAQLPEDVPYQMWTVLIENIMYTMIEGFSKVKKCSASGRALMQLDVQSMQHALKAMVPGALPSMEPVDDYIKAFYHTYEELLEWIPNVHTRYLAKQLQALVTINTNVIDRQKKSLQDKLAKVEEELQRLGHVDVKLF